VEQRLLRGADLDALDEAYAAVAAAGRGRTVFLAGDDAAGRGDLLREWASGLAAARPRPTVLGGGFEGEEYTPWGDDGPRAMRAVQAIETALTAVSAGVTLSEVALPGAITRLVGQVVSRSQAALGLVTSAIAISDRPSQAPILAQAFEGLCRDGPAICILDGVDERPSSLWNGLAWLLSRHIARDVPLLLVLGLDGPRHIGEPIDQEPEAMAIVRELTSDVVDVATWHWLSPLTAVDVLQWTGPATSDTISWLLEITSGRSGETRQRWHDWQQRGLIENRSEGRWRFAAGHDPTLDMDGLLDGRTRRLCGRDTRLVAATQRFLGCAALEGRHFTAEAVALAIDPKRNAGDVVAFLDATLSLDEAHPDGLVVADTATIRSDDDALCLARYRFARELDWIALRHHGLSEGEQRHYARNLAQALERLYGSRASVRADTLARLFEIAGSPARARHYENVAGIRTDSRIRLWRARNALNVSDPTDAIGRYRKAEVLIDGARELSGVGPFDEGVTFARAAERIADDDKQRATAVFFTGVHLVFAGEPGRARAELARATDLYRALGGPSGIAGAAEALTGLATLDRDEGQLDRARDKYRAVLALHRERGDERREAAMHNALAICDREQGRIDEARAGHKIALEIYCRLGDRGGEADGRHGLASCDRHQGRIEEARSGYTTTLEIVSDLGNRRWQADLRHVLALCDREQGRIDDARDGFTTALGIYRDLSYPRGEAEARGGLASCDRDQGSIDDARAGYTAALGIFRSLGDLGGEALSRLGLADCDLDAGKIDDARMGYATALEIFSDLDDLRGEARARHALGDCDRAQGRIEGARAAYGNAAAIFHDLGHSEREAALRRELDDLDSASPGTAEAG
jgi:tetratricopeptide (TPR) repeat protein